MKIQYCSDLHIEFPENLRFLKRKPIEPVGDILVLAGDIVPLNLTKFFRTFFKKLSAQYSAIYWLPGNHEYYQSEFDNSYQSFCKEVFPNVFLVNNHTVELNEVNLIFTTLWGNISPQNSGLVQKSVSDFHVIKCNNELFNTSHFNSAHVESFQFLKRELNRNRDGKYVVVTHHVPTLLNYPENYKDSPINEAFAVELFDFIEQSEVSFWIYGHHHSNVTEFSIGKTKLVTNQLGYVRIKEQNGFRTNAVISTNDM